MRNSQRNLVDLIESISEQIQVLALNIAVAAAKMSFNKEITLEVNSKLSQLVNQATMAVKNMGHVLRAAKADKPKGDLFAANEQSRIDSEIVQNIENSLQMILDDSQKILSMLNQVKHRSLR
jgi:methyl-accepting chemotaxis protein